MTKRKNKVANSLSKFFLTTVILTIIFVFGYFFYQQRNFLVTKENKLSTLITYIKTDKENTKLYKISVEYPIFDQAPQDFNNLIESTVASRVGEFKKQATQNWEIRRKMSLPSGKAPEYPETPFTLNVSWAPQQLNTQYISLILRINSFVSGANEIQSLAVFNYDLKSNREVKLADLFPNNTDYLSLISNLAKNDLTQQLKANWGSGASYKNAKDILEEGTAPKEDNFKNFTFDDNIINFYFPKYQVAPGSLGEQQFLLPRD